MVLLLGAVRALLFFIVPHGVGLCREETVFLGQYRHFFDQMARSDTSLPICDAYRSRIGLKHWSIKRSTCSGALPMCCSGSNASSMLTPANAGSARSRCKRSLVAAPSRSSAWTSRLCARMISWVVCRSAPWRTAAISSASVAKKGISRIKLVRHTAGLAISPWATFRRMPKVASVAKNPSAKVNLRLAESSRVRSSHWVAAVWYVLGSKFITNRAKPQARSHRMGLRL